MQYVINNRKMSIFALEKQKIADRNGINKANTIRSVRF